LGAARSDRQTGLMSDRAVISCAGAVHDGTHLAEDQSLRTSTSSSAERPSSWRTRVCTRVCIDRTKRTLVEFGNYLGCYFIDERAAVTALLRNASAGAVGPRPSQRQ
jgi:hypothetical protein